MNRSAYLTVLNSWYGLVRSKNPAARARTDFDRVKRKLHYMMVHTNQSIVCHLTRIYLDALQLCFPFPLIQHYLVYEGNSSAGASVTPL